MQKSVSKARDISIVLTGEAGQGLKSVEYILSHVLKKVGYSIFSTKEVMSRIRGGANSTEIRVSNHPVSSFVDRIDFLFPLNPNIERLKHRIDEETILIGNADDFEEDYNIVNLSLEKLSEEFGELYQNVIAAAVLLAFFSVPFSKLEEFLEEYFQKKGKEIIDKNKQAAEAGYTEGKKILDSGRIEINLEPDSKYAEYMLANGAEAVGMGALAGGCNFIASYPMSPSTGVLVFLAGQSKKFKIVVEQAEDEIAAINMGLGAWYAGARAMVTTSGGGFALMQEGMSMAGMGELPMVVHIAQRVGPATGLPTRHEQGDLNFVIHSGHGDFPRVVYAPGNTEEAFELAARSFNIADQFQIPAILLTDQFLVDSYRSNPPFDVALIPFEPAIVETDESYERFAYTKTGISPRGVPGNGKGFVCVDSDEHDTGGRITESWEVREKMVHKRMKRLQTLRKEAIPPSLIGAEDYETLLVAWGSTLEVLREALDELGDDSVAVAHFKQVYPVHDSIKELLGKAKTTVVVENNYSAQFNELLNKEFGVQCEHEITQYNGFPFSVETLVDKLRELTGGNNG